MTAARPLSPALERLADALTYLRQAPRPLITSRVPVDAVSFANLRNKWGAIETTQAARTWAKTNTLIAIRTLGRIVPAGHSIIRLTRHIQPKGRAYDDDNLARALKPYRDGVADALGVDDGSERLTWVVDQVRDCNRGVTVEIWVRP